jgi:photosystem II stability/assembly factor-like uncharacterized protein
LENFFRNTVLVLFVAFVSSSQIYSQWVEQTSSTSVSLRSVRAVNDNVVWACGASGVVLKTTNGGTNWNLCTTTLASATNHCIDALDATTAWVTGTVGSGNDQVNIWKTTNGGTTWTSQYSSSTGFGNGVRFFNSNYGVYYGDPNPLSSGNWKILTTSNGGTNWNEVPSANFPAADNTKGEWGNTNSLEIFGDNVWFNTNYGTIQTNPIHVYKSTNKGLNWTSYSVTFPSGPTTWPKASTIAFSSALNGAIAASNGDIGFTTDGGVNWSLSTIGVPFYGISNVPGRNAFFTVGNPGVSYYSENGGAWTYYNTNISSDKLNCIDATANYAWAAGTNGKIVRFQFTQSKINTNFKIYLQGCYNNGSMLTSLRDGGYLPLSQPYNTAPWSYTGTESVTTTIPSGVVDWVLVELRSGLTANTKVAQRAAFLKSDGTIVDLDGTSQLGFNGLANGTYRIVIYHRNHLAIMSSSAVTFTSGSTSIYDFTDNQNKAYTTGPSPMKEFVVGKYGMYAGDANGNGFITSGDKNTYWLPQNGLSGYLSGDFNLNGFVTSGDKNLFWLPNNGLSTQVP